MTDNTEENEGTTVELELIQELTEYARQGIQTLQRIDRSLETLGDQGLINILGLIRQEIRGVRQLLEDKEDQHFATTPDGKPICPKHGIAMDRRDMQGDVWFSHKVLDASGEEQFCRGYAHASSAGFNVPAKEDDNPPVAQRPKRTAPATPAARQAPAVKEEPVPTAAVEPVPTATKEEDPQRENVPWSQIPIEEKIGAAFGKKATVAAEVVAKAQAVTAPPTKPVAFEDLPPATSAADTTGNGDESATTTFPDGSTPPDEMLKLLRKYIDQHDFARPTPTQFWTWVHSEDGNVS